MLLSVDTLNLPKHGTILEFWKVGAVEPEFIQRPFNPFFYSWKQWGQQEKEITVLKDLQKKKVWKVEFEDTNVLERHRTSYTFQDNIPYKQLVAALLGFKEVSPKPAHVAVDIETYKGKVVACGWYEPKEQIVFTGSEFDILASLNVQLQEKNPDIIDTYWGSYFDVKNLMEAAKRNNVKLKWGRDESQPYIRKREYSRGPKKGVEHTVKIRGRIHFDVWKEVEMDQTLRGIKNKKLQTVAEWFGFGTPTKYDHANLMQYGMEVVKSECLEDCRKTWLLAEHYLKNLYVLAEDFLYLPLNMIVERSPSHPPNTIYMREYERINVVATESNRERFPQFFHKAKKAYEGAFTKLYNPGIYEGDLFKDDFKSMYPSVMACFNLDPLTVKLLSVEPALKPEWIVKFQDDKIMVYDKNVKGIITVQISTEESISKRWIQNLMLWRKEVTDRVEKEGKTPELESRQWAIKVLMNALYGYHGMKYARYGCAPIAALVTGIGRFFMLETVKFVVSQVKTVIEVDTDGVYIQRGWTDFHVQDLEAYIKTLIPERYDSSFIHITEETYDAGIFYEEKGYVLKKGEKLNFYGSGLIGRHHSKVCDRVLEEVIERIFKGEQVKDILWKYTKLKDFPLSDFVMTAELKKHPDQYDSKSMYYSLLKQLREAGKDIELGMEVSYVKVKKKYKPIGLSGSYDLDYDYYRKRIARTLAAILKPTQKLNVSTIEKIMLEGQMVF